MFKVRAFHNVTRMRVEVAIAIVDEDGRPINCLRFDSGLPVWEPYAEGAETPVAYSFPDDYCDLLYKELEKLYGSPEGMMGQLYRRADQLMETLIEQVKASD